MPTNPVLTVRHFRVVELRWETREAFTVVLAPEISDEMLSFKPGQWVYLHLLNPDGTSWARAAFSIASAPEESHERLELCIKIYGDYTKRASKLMPDDVVGIQGPFGVFTLHEGVSPLILFAGGIGITPLRCMIRSLAARKSPTEVTLFYSNKIIEETVYLEEFEQLAKEWPAFHPTFILTQQAPRAWKGEIGRLDEAMLRRHAPNLERGEFLMCGPVSFMDGVKELLSRQGVEVKTRLRKELFG